MPVIIEQKQASANTYSPKFFNQILTGNGKRQGLLRVELDNEHDRYGHGVLLPFTTFHWLILQLNQTPQKCILHKSS